ncbi:glycosyltransferase family 4 protein [Morganella morganii]|uniref:glycosyltransferase family 4 protein n=1 Tax=Morganella morganii TaxID=582 RepID=UPI00309E531D
MTSESIKIIHVVPSDKNTGPVNVAKDLIFGLNNSKINASLFNLRGKTRKNLISSFFSLLNLINNEHIILHSHGIIPDIYCYIISRLKKIKWVSTIHVDPEEDLKFIYPKLYKIICFIWNKILKKADHAVYLTEYISSKQNNKNKKTIVNSRFLKHYEYDKKLENKITLGFCGALIERKNIVNLVNIIKKNSNYDLILAGDGPLISNLKKTTADSEHIMLLGHQDDLSTFWGKIHILVLPSLAEGVPLVAIEALSKGIPLILMDLQNYNGIFTPNETVFITELAEYNLFSAIHKIESNYSEYSTAAKQRYKDTFNFDSWILKYRLLYE